MLRAKRLLLVACLVCLAGACTRVAEQDSGHSGVDAGVIRAVVSILPQAYLVERVGGDLVTVSVLVGPGSSPATYEPTPRQMAELGEADLLITSGVPFERSLITKIAQILPELRIVDGVARIELKAMAPADVDGPADGEEREEHEAGHDHGRLDPHFWLDPQLAGIHAETICDELCRLAPERSEELRANLATLISELNAADAGIAARLAPFQGRSILVFHPAYGYFARRYGLHQVAVEIEGKEPSARQLSRLIEQARATGARAIFVQPQYSVRSAKVIAGAIGGTVVPLDPLAADYLANLELMAERIAGAFAR